MFIISPGVVMEWANTPDQKFLLDMRVDVARDLFANRFAVPTDQQYDRAAEILQEIAELALDKEQIRGLLALYPRVRIEITEGADDAYESLAFCIAHFVLGCSWPKYGDKLDIDAFVEVLQAQAEKLGFKRAAIA